MSIYSTLWSLMFPKQGWAYHPDEHTRVWAQAVPAHIDVTGPEWDDWLPPPVPFDPESPAFQRHRAVFICWEGTTKGTSDNGQRYVDPLLVLTGKEYEEIPWVCLHQRIAEAVAERFGRDLSVVPSPIAGPAGTVFRAATPQEEPPTMESLLTVPQAAERLRLGRSTVYALVQRGEIPHIRIGKIVRIPEGSLAAWVTSRISTGRVDGSVEDGDVARVAHDGSGAHDG